MDLCFSGYTATNFVDAAQMLFALGRRRSLPRLDIWGEHGEPNRSHFSSGTGIDDALGLLDIRFDKTVRISCHFGRENEADEGSLIFEVVRSDRPGNVSGIDGLVLWPTNPSGMLAADLERELERFIVDAVATFRGFVTVSDEDDQSLVVSEDPVVRIPVLYAGVAGEISPTARQALLNAGHSIRVEDDVTILRVEKDVRHGNRFEALADWTRSLCHLL
jgi:hypothetical protein